MPAFTRSQLVIGCWPDVTAREMFRLYKCTGIGSLVDFIPALNAFVIDCDGNEFFTARQCFINSSEVEFTEANRVIKFIDPINPRPFFGKSRRDISPDVVPNDPLFPRQYGLRNVGAPQGWNNARLSGQRFTIAILDTGIDSRHPDLKSKIGTQVNFSNSPTSQDRNGHGTHVAGIAAAATNNRRGVAGISFNSVRIMNVKVLGDNGSGLDSWVANGIVFAANKKVTAVNMSLGGPGASSLLSRAVTYAAKKGVVLVASAGNSGNSRVQFPAGFTSVIAVSATGTNNRKASFSNFGSWVDVAAPGVNILSTMPTYPNRLGPRNYGFLSGTSMSAPFVTGLAGLIKAKFRNKRRKQIISAIERRARHIGGTGSRFGLISVPGSLRR